MFRYGGKARGVTLVELLTAIPLSLLILTAVLQLFFLAVRTFERNEDMSAAPGWDAAEKFLAFLGTPARHCGVGLPGWWDSSLFSTLTHPGALPAWSLWGSAAVVGNSRYGESFAAVGDGWGNTLRIVYGVPRDVILLEDLCLRRSESAPARFSDALRIAGATGERKTSSWILFPGTSTPVHVVSDAQSDRPLLRARRDTRIPWGAPAFRLMALQICAYDGRLYVNYYDDSGNQPLAQNVEEVRFRLEKSGLLHARITARSPGSGFKIQEARSWRLGL